MNELLENLKAIESLRQEPIFSRAVDRIEQLEAENAALKTALDHQMTYQRELRADRDRLDWLETKGAWMTIPGDQKFRNGTARAVIDEAMGEGK